MATDIEFLQKLDNPEDRTRSLIDLIDVQTVNLELAAFLASHIWRGASYSTIATGMKTTASFTNHKRAC